MRRRGEAAEGRKVRERGGKTKGDKGSPAEEEQKDF